MQRAGAALLIGLIVSGSTASRAQEVELLRFPHPYRAAVTVCSDTHTTTPEMFEAVHKLVNSRDRIAKGSPEWDLLFSDPAIRQGAKWAAGVQGFDLPLADSIWLYDPTIGVFAGFDEAAGRPIPHVHDDGRDFRDIVDGWLRRGWIDSLHTVGEGELSREAVRQGLDWLNQAPHRRIPLWVNHNLYKARSAIEPDTLSALGLVVPNLLRLVTWVGVRTPLEGFLRRVMLFPAPRPFPPTQRGLLWALSGALAATAGALVLCLGLRRLRRRRVLVGLVALLALQIGVLWSIPLRFAQGDNPGTAFYNVDLVRAEGVGFFSLNWVPAAVFDERLDLPERAWGDRDSFLRAVTLDDGSQVWMFPRSNFGKEGTGSLEGLTEAHLEELMERQRAAILYTHWMNQPVFTAAGLEGLENLRRRFRAGEIWVAPTHEIVRFELVRTFLRFEVHSEDGALEIALGPVEDPLGGSFQPDLEDLRGISFSLPRGRPLQVRLDGRVLPPDRYEVLAGDGRRILRFPLEPAS